MLLLLSRVNVILCQLQYHHQIRANFVTYKTSINNDNDNNNSNCDSNSSNKGDSVKKICTQDKSGTLVNYEILII